MAEFDSGPRGKTLEILAAQAHQQAVRPAAYFAARKALSSLVSHTRLSTGASFPQRTR